LAWLGVLGRLSFSGKSQLETLEAKQAQELEQESEIVPQTNRLA
jgi:hypothetical protein